ncbi:uncharacterized protein LOC128198325 isoform X8 [Bicyclus anynana]|uniref:Uncharacterized protein LOC128198325 isoform X8 n=1 Tax=Bicyclus anynana TaxID=110368 RepID=A0ABM3LJ20_BICAN|nr:uncharacterized protein LOC128198325 isoform X8 [Bicyclus anynana]
MGDAKIKELTKLRGSVKGKLTIFQNYLNSFDDSNHDDLTENQVNELECRLNKVDSLHVEFDKFQTELEMLSEDPSQLFSEREEFDQKYFSLVASARTIMNRSRRQLHRRLSVSETSEGSVSRDGGFRDFVRLPKISLPFFNGEKMENWLEFRDTYLSLIHNCSTIALVNVVGVDGRLHTARALLDNGATAHYVTQHLCEKLGLARKNVSSTVTVKAVHLELVTDLTKEAFLAAFFRFISRHGKPLTVTSDNSTTFLGASNDISNFFTHLSEDIKADLSTHGINFKTIPPYTPHMGGLWESAVKSVKHHLKRILNLTHLTYEEMATCLAQIEAILNSRPLTPLSSDPSDLSCLTPAHFLIGRPLLSVPRPPVSDAKLSALDRYQRIEKLKQHFWDRFSIEYISLLQQRTRWQSASPDLQLGSLVLIKERGQPPLLWLLGRIVKLHSGRDGVSRVAEIQTRRGLITRAYNNICPLPI